MAGSPRTNSLSTASQSDVLHSTAQFERAGKLPLLYIMLSQLNALDECQPLLVLQSWMTQKIKFAAGRTPKAIAFVYARRSGAMNRAAYGDAWTAHRLHQAVLTKRAYSRVFLLGGIDGVAIETDVDIIFTTG